MSLTEQQSPASGGMRAFVIGAYISRKNKPSISSTLLGEANIMRDPQSRIDEAVGLALAIDLDIVQALLFNLNDIRPSTYLGKGKVEDIAQDIKDKDISLVVMDCALSPIQQRNLERAWAVKVIDRTGLILEIFGSRAHTREGTLQVELAHLSYQKSRLVRSWTHLERQRGGFGFLGGPGETQIEADRRIIQDRMNRLEQDLEAVKRTRSLHRASRKRVPYPVIALVGYTNAGKSSLFNRLSSSEVMAEDMLFATLDPTARAIKLPHGGKAILSDTVGFISDLPTMLVAAFRATLEDVIEADILLHVRDVSHPDTLSQSADVHAVLRELGIDSQNGMNIIEVWNKSDLLSREDQERLLNLSAGRPKELQPILLSALTGEGIERLLAAIESRIASGRGVYLVTLNSSEGALLHWLYEEAEVLERRADEKGCLSIVVRIAPEKESRLLNRCKNARRIR